METTPAPEIPVLVFPTLGSKTPTLASVAEQPLAVKEATLYCASFEHRDFFQRIIEKFPRGSIFPPREACLHNCHLQRYISYKGRRYECVCFSYNNWTRMTLSLSIPWTRDDGTKMLFSVMYNKADIEINADVLKLTLATTATPSTNSVLCLDDTTCAICLEEVKDVGHCFSCKNYHHMHIMCGYNWLSKNRGKCPTCKETNDNVAYYDSEEDEE